MNEKMNFNPGPTALPDEVLTKAQTGLNKELHSGISILEMSHRSQEYQLIHDNAKSELRHFLAVPESHDILFLQGGASLQFTMVPMNLLSKYNTAYHIVTGSWAEKAFNESQKIGKTQLLASSKHTTFDRIPKRSDWNVDVFNTPSYLHITSNNTIYGTQWQDYEDLPDLPIVMDISSDVGTKDIPWDRVTLAYAGAQKNLGAAGVTVIIINKELLVDHDTERPIMLDYNAHAKKGSLHNTPPAFNIYVLGLMVQWMNQEGGLQEFEDRSNKKSELFYRIIDQSNDFYKGHAEKSSRSKMNVTFKLPTSELNEAFLRKANEAGFVGISGHRSIGGCRISLYNGIEMEACEKLAHFMETFKQVHSN
ncbi:3-phosphoserine/phosphohydroxythreonine transaminase [Pseudalkalibacillus berkeleyi]|uniref:Phosphoserine aminotransferase n=1 Tax=Pseudalkalibacillus berkeleyi TaxID=1069813 RepID=A0ABS9GTL8_9BACL|nr:3-phosphoserine/phosphohydroxythreonine transaminase [Pseudalkalibacillus berkeleyi]MCF6136182.1 3-phosphoserine/phosphohydroxythreonine transaminase [Pseudalkalibacillus berkeleyi]